MASRRARSLVIRVLGAIAVAAGCDRAPARSPSGVTTTSGSLRPEARPPSTRTVDNTGFIDNAGRSSNERGRTEMSGMRATEAGSEVPTGTPASGFPLTTESRTARERASAGGASTIGGVPSGAVVGRVAQALCDYEMSCDRVGQHEPWASLAACVDAKRSVAREDLASASCPNRFDPTAVASCLASIRLASCDQRVERMQAVEGCESSALCMKR